MDSRPSFAPYHPKDRNAFLVFAGLIWATVLAGFVPSIVGHVSRKGFDYPIIVHLHAAAFVGWLVLFTVQILLIRSGRTGLHRKLGYVGAGLAASMVVLGLSVAVYSARKHFGEPGGDIGSIAIQLTDMLAFGSLAAAAVLLRKDASAHKRLILIATIYITGAGFNRWVIPLMFLAGLFTGPPGPVLFFCAVYLGLDLLYVGLGLYDLATRKRLHPAYVAGMIFVLTCQALATTLYFTPAWAGIATKLIGR